MFLIKNRTQVDIVFCKDFSHASVFVKDESQTWSKGMNSEKFKLRQSGRAGD